MLKATRLLAIMTALVGAASAAPCSKDNDLFPHKTSIEHATLAKLSYHGYYKIVEITTKSGGTWTALLVQNGCDAPADVPNVNTTVTIPITSVAVTDTTSLPFVELLGERPSIAAVGTDDAYITSNCIHFQIEQNTTKVAYNPNTWGVDSSMVTSAGVDGGATVTLAGYYAESTITSAGMNMLPMQEPYEPSALGSAEWMKIVSALYNKEKVAEKVFAGTVTRMDCGSTNTIDDGKVGKSRILWFSSYAGWGSPDETINVGKCTSKTSPYYCEYADRAGAEIVNYTDLNILPNDAGSHTPAQIAELCAHADYIFYQSDFPAMWEGRGLNASAMANCSLVSQGKVYDMQAGDAGGNAVFERRLSEPDLMLGDFANIVEQGVFTHVAKQPNAFLRNVMTDPVGGSSENVNPSCSSVDEAALALPALNRNCARTFFLEVQQDAANTNNNNTTNTPPADDDTSSAEIASGTAAAAVTTALAMLFL